ncbi:MAG: hypothetical protein Q8R11_02300 [bacterium]|nr:hypothetical protein [bacterium]
MTNQVRNGHTEGVSFKIVRVVFPLLMFAAAILITTAVIKSPVQTNSKAFEKKATPTVKTTPKPSPSPSSTPSATPSSKQPTWESLKDVNGDGIINTLDYAGGISNR